jgi:hypothetical protein
MHAPCPAHLIILNLIFGESLSVQIQKVIYWCSSSQSGVSPHVMEDIQDLHSIEAGTELTLHKNLQVTLVYHITLSLKQVDASEMVQKIITFLQSMACHYYYYLLFTLPILIEF